MHNYNKAFVLTILSCSINLGLTTPSFSQENKYDQYEVGDIKTSLLQPKEFIQKYGNVWVLMDGREVSGSDFSMLSGINKIPDARGKFLRMNNNGANCNDKNNCAYDPDNTKLGEFQNDNFKSHHHTQRFGNVKGHFSSSGWESVPHVDRGSTNGQTTTLSGGSETRPKNISVNYYIKVNYCVESDEMCR